MGTVQRVEKETLAGGAIILAAVLVLGVLNTAAIGKRSLPPGPVILVRTAATQADVYAVYREMGIRGAHVVQVGPFFNMMPFFPEQPTVPVPFPILPSDIRPLYEAGIDSHNWLFIANRTGMVRMVTTVLPEALFRESVPALEEDFAFSRRGAGYAGYLYELPRSVFSMADFPHIAEPVVVNVDAGVFRDGLSPMTLYETLHRRLTDVRAIVLVRSEDEPGVTDMMRRGLAEFGSAASGGLR